MLVQVVLKGELESTRIMMDCEYLQNTSKLVPLYFRGRRVELARSRNSWNIASMRKMQLKLDINSYIIGFANVLNPYKSM